MARRWTVNPPMGQVIGGWIGAMIVLGIAGGWLFGPAEVTLHTVPMTPRPPVDADARRLPVPAEIDAQRAADREVSESAGEGHGTAGAALDAATEVSRAARCRTALSRAGVTHVPPGVRAGRLR